MKLSRACIFVAAGLTAVFAAVVFGQFASVPEQGRSMTVTQYGIVAAPQFLAAQAGTEILRAGGNAVDAAIAANAVMGVTQPYVNGMGGDLFALVYQAKTGKLYGLNSSGWTPKALTIDYLKEQHVEKLDPIGVHTITVPGCVAGGTRSRIALGVCRSNNCWGRRFIMPRMDFRWRKRTRAIG